MAILIVEDNPVSAKLVEQTLKKYDFETLMAGNGVEALEILSKNPSSIEIVITDVMMPEMDGLTLAQKMKTSPQCAHIPVIICTVLKDAENIKEAAAIGCRHYLLKPYRPEELRAKVLECRRNEKKVMRSQAEIISHYHLKENQYAEIRAAFRQLLEGYISFTDEKRKSNNNGELDLGNIHECSVIFGAERLKNLLEQREKGEHTKIDDPELNQALLSEMSNVVKALSK
jgi:two-component system, chemotaxis family, chemotaxis protein CheY